MYIIFWELLDSNNSIHWVWSASAMSDDAVSPCMSRCLGWCSWLSSQLSEQWLTIQGNYKYLAHGTRAAVDVNEVGKVRLTDALLRRILHVSLDALMHRRTDAFYQHPYQVWIVAKHFGEAREVLELELDWPVNICNVKDRKFVLLNSSGYCSSTISHSTIEALAWTCRLCCPRTSRLAVILVE